MKLIINCSVPAGWWLCVPETYNHRLAKIPSVTLCLDFRADVRRTSPVELHLKRDHTFWESVLIGKGVVEKVIVCVVVTNLIYRFKHSGNCYHVLYLCCSVFISRRTSILKWHISSSLLLFIYLCSFYYSKWRYIVFPLGFLCLHLTLLYFPLSFYRSLYSPVQNCAVMFRNSLKMLLGGKSNRKNRNSGRLSFLFKIWTLPYNRTPCKIQNYIQLLSCKTWG